MTERASSENMPLRLEPAAYNVAYFAAWLHIHRSVPPARWVQAAVDTWEVTANFVGGTLLQALRHLQATGIIVPRDGRGVEAYLNRAARRRFQRGG